MSNSKATDEPFAPPLLQQGARGKIERASLAGVVQWFLDYDQRVSVVKHPSVEELFQWKQEEDKRETANFYLFGRAEDRLAIGIFQALTVSSGEILTEWRESS